MKILLTGATGFLGSRVLPLLVEHEVLCLVRNAGRLAKVSNARALPGDLTRMGAWTTEIERFAPQWCIHLAWEGLPDYSLSRCRANLDAGIGLFELLARSGIERIVVAGSCWEYGGATGAVREDQPPIECGLFASTKQALRVMLESISRAAGIESRWARIFFAYGPGQRSNSLIPHCYAAYAAGRNPEIRNPELAQDFVFVEDVATGIMAVAQCDAGSGIFNIGSGRPTTVAHVVNRVARHFDRTPPFPSAQSTSGFWADTARTAAATGWQVRTSVDEGIARTLSALGRRQ